MFSIARTPGIIQTINGHFPLSRVTNSRLSLSSLKDLMFIGALSITEYLTGET